MASDGDPREDGRDDGGEVACPHCRKTFVPAPLALPTARHRGTKCPHCRLFVPLDRVGEQVAGPGA